VSVTVRTKGSGEVTYYVYGLGLIGEESTGNYFSYHFDYRGSTVALTNVVGQVVDRIAYSAYGELLTQPTHDTPFLFNGMYGVMSDDNGLYYMRARFYSPEIKRFVNQDVLLGNVADGQALNRYAYVMGDPVRYNDPFGLDREGRCGPGEAPISDPNQPHVGYCKKDGSDSYEAICVTELCGREGVAVTQKAVGLFNVHLCFGKIRNYSHAYICVNRKCAGLMPYPGKGLFPSSKECPGIIMSEEFNVDHCAVATLPKSCNREVYGVCMEKFVNSVGDCEYYNLLLHDCIHEILDVEKQCLSQACPQ